MPDKVTREAYRGARSRETRGISRCTEPGDEKTRFSARPAPLHPGGVPGLPDNVTREAYRGARSRETRRHAFLRDPHLFIQVAFRVCRIT